VAEDSVRGSKNSFRVPSSARGLKSREARSSGVVFGNTTMRRRMGSTNVIARSVQCADIPGSREADATLDHCADLSRSRWRESGTLVGGGCEDQATVAVHARIPTHVPEELLREQSRLVPRTSPGRTRPSGNENADAVPWAHPLRHRDACQRASDPQAPLGSPANRGNPPPVLGNLPAGERHFPRLRLCPPNETQIGYMPQRRYIL
jgi:hypothetical protein